MRTNNASSVHHDTSRLDTRHADDQQPATARIPLQGSTGCFDREPTRDSDSHAQPPPANAKLPHRANRDKFTMAFKQVILRVQPLATGTEDVDV